MRLLGHDWWISGTGTLENPSPQNQLDKIIKNNYLNSEVNQMHATNREAFIWEKQLDLDKKSGISDILTQKCSFHSQYHGAVAMRNGQGWTGLSWFRDSQKSSTIRDDFENRTTQRQLLKQWFEGQCVDLLPSETTVTGENYKTQI